MSNREVEQYIADQRDKYRVVRDRYKDSDDKALYYLYDKYVEADTIVIKMLEEMVEGGR